MSICIKTPIKKPEPRIDFPSENEYLYKSPSLFLKTHKNSKTLQKPNLFLNISKKLRFLQMNNVFSGRN